MKRGYIMKNKVAKLLTVKMENKTYDFLKNVALTYLPAAGTLYFTLSGIWGLPFAKQVVGTVVAVDTFLGVILGISKEK